MPWLTSTATTKTCGSCASTCVSDRPAAAASADGICCDGQYVLSFADDERPLRRLRQQHRAGERCCDGGCVDIQIDHDNLRRLQPAPATAPRSAPVGRASPARPAASSAATSLLALTRDIGQRLVSAGAQHPRFHGRTSARRNRPHDRDRDGRRPAGSPPAWPPRCSAGWPCPRPAAACKNPGRRCATTNQDCYDGAECRGRECGCKTGRGAATTSRPTPTSSTPSRCNRRRDGGAVCRDGLCEGRDGGFPFVTVRPGSADGRVTDSPRQLRVAARPGLRRRHDQPPDPGVQRRRRLPGRVGRTGDRRRGFCNPFGVAIAADGDVFVAVEHRVQRFDGAGIFKNAWASSAPPPAGSTPNGVAVDGGGSVLVAELATAGSSGSDPMAFLQEVGEGGISNVQFAGVQGVAVDFGRVFVATTRRSVRRAGRRFHLAFGSRGSGEASSCGPRGSPSMPPAASSWRTSTTTASSSSPPTARFVTAFGSRGGDAGEFQFPRGHVALDGQGNVYMDGTATAGSRSSRRPEPPSHGRGSPDSRSGRVARGEDRGGTMDATPDRR